MSDAIRFHLDESVNPAIADGLKRYGIDVTTSHHTELLGASDEKHLAFALSEKRVIVTHDDDFLAVADQGTEHAGIAYCHAKARTIGEIIDALVLIHRCLSPDEMHNHIEFL